MACLKRAQNGTIMTHFDTFYMSHALQLAERGLYTTDPNPRVGCVIVKSDQVVGRGWHVRAGEPHAEIHALREAGEQARGATVYVTLEPCCHVGRTPPCTEALIEAGVARVVAAMTDPNPNVAGLGFARLQQAGIATSCGVLEAQARALNPGFIARMTRQRPWVRLKVAASLDGRTALASGESRWITGEAARWDVQRWRARSSAILTGVDTVLMDNPRFNVRLPNVSRQPIRVILDSQLRLPPTAQLVSQWASDGGRVLVLTTVADRARHQPLLEAGAEIQMLPKSHDGHLDLYAVMTFLAQQDINELHVECGATLAGALLAAGLIDELVLYLAPCVLGDGARGLFHVPDIATMDQRIEWFINDVRAVGTDWRILAHPASPPA